MNASKIPLAPDESKEGRDFEKLVMWVCSLSIGVMAGFLASLKQVNPVIQIRFSGATVIAFVAGGILTALYLRMVLRANRRRRAVLVVAAAIACMFAYFFIGIRDTSHEVRSDVIFGTVAAVIVLSGVAYVLYRLGHYFESDQPDDRDFK